MEKIDHAFKRFEKILSEISTYTDSIFSEQDSRIKIIDRILMQVLDYQFKDVLTEPRAGKGFLDYKVLVNGIPKLGIEAKKDGIDFNIEHSYSGRAFNLSGPVFNDKAIQEGIDQAIYYAAYKGIELSCLTNGKCWIIFRSNRLGDGKDVLAGKGFVFSSLESVKKEFKLFYELLSPEGINDLRYRALFQEAEGAEIRLKDFSQSIKSELEIKVLERQTYSHDIDRVMNEFFSRLSGDSDPDMLRECFVETRESQNADQELCRISDDLIRRVRSLETKQAEALTELIEKVKSTNRHEFVILMGTKGAGKTTFIDRFFENVIPDELKTQCIVVRINLGISDGNHQTIIEWMNQTLLEECEKVLYKGKPKYEEIQGMFYFEYERLSEGNWNKLYEKDKEQFKIDFGKHIEERREKRPNEYIKRMIGEITRSRFKVPCIIFDNADHFSIDFQEKVFQYASVLST
jgi:AAA domain